MAIMVCVSGGAAGVATYLYITGYLFDAVGFQAFGYILIFCATSYILIFSIMQLFVWKCGQHEKAPGEELEYFATYSQLKVEEDEFTDEDSD